MIENQVKQLDGGPLSRGSLMTAGGNVPEVLKPNQTLENMSSD